MSTVVLSHPPAPLLRVANPVITLLLHTPLSRSVGRDFMVVAVTGRKSGRRYTIPVSAHHLDGTLYAITNAAWRYNFRGGADAEITHRGTTTTMRGELIGDPTEVAQLCRRSVLAYGPSRAALLLGMKFTGGTPTVEDFAEIATREHLAAIRFTAPA